MTVYRGMIGFGLFLASLATCLADPPPAIHYAPAENLERIDVALIDQAQSSIDMAAYVLTDWPVMQALARAAQRKVKIRIYLDAGRIGEREPTPPFLNRQSLYRCTLQARWRAFDASQKLPG